MCGRYNLITDAQAILDAFEVSIVSIAVSALQPRYNISPSHNIPIIRDIGDGRELAELRWGLVPRWFREPHTKYSTINARAETVAEKPAYRDALVHRRCLIPATGFYEWHRSNNHKVPYHIRMRDHSLIAFAGLWERWGKDDQILETCAIIVTEANTLIKPIHDRMPVILDHDASSHWLNHAITDKDELLPLLQPYDGSKMEAYSVTQRVNNPGHDDSGCIEPVQMESSPTGC